MAVTVRNLSTEYPEFRRPISSRSAISANRVVRVARPQTERVKVRRNRKSTFAGSLLRGRLLDDLCAVAVVGTGIFFAIHIARMLLMS